MWIPVYKNYVDDKDTNKLKKYVEFLNKCRNHFKPKKVRLLFVTIAPTVPEKAVWTNGLDRKLIRFVYNIESQGGGQSRLCSRLYSILCLVKEKYATDIFPHINCDPRSISTRFLSALRDDGIVINLQEAL